MKESFKIYIEPYCNLKRVNEYDCILWKKVSKGAWRMPWLSEAMKDVISCDKLRVGANSL